MPSDRVYIDSCCFIEAIKSDVGIADEARNDDVWYTKKLLEASKNGDIEVITSVFTLAECRKAEKEGPPSDEVKRLISSILTSGKVVKLVQVTQNIAERARDLQWVDGINLSGADSIHVASALVLNCKEFHTYDFNKKSPIKYSKELEVLGLKAISPAETLLLPPGYNQHSLPLK